MRFTGLLLAILFTLGCGVGNRDPRTTFSTNFSPPALMELSPSAVPVNSVPFILTVNGTNFGTDAVVFWNDMPHSTRFISSKQLLAAVTETDLMQFGLARVFVRTGGLNSNTLDFDVTAQGESLRAPKRPGDTTTLGAQIESMRLDPQTQGDARTKKHADVCNGYLPTKLASEEERKKGCAECCDCWCHSLSRIQMEPIGTTAKHYALRLAG